MQVGQLQASRVTNIETHVQQEVKRVTSLVQVRLGVSIYAHRLNIPQAEKERELANIEQRYSRLTSPQVSCHVLCTHNILT